MGIGGRMNNYEKIKQMSLDEMADFIKRLKTTYCRYKELNFNCVGCIIENLCDLPLSKTKQWLQEESK